MGSQKYAPALDVDIKRIAGAKAKLAAEGLRKNDLTFGGNLGLHRKTILPSFLPCRNQRHVGGIGAVEGVRLNAPLCHPDRSGGICSSPDQEPIRMEVPPSPFVIPP
jgi:hypothetical protein